MALIRAFLALEVSSEVAEASAEVIQALADVPGPRVRWVEPDQMHITLQFFGEIQFELSHEIYRAVAAELAEMPIFDFSVTDLGAFPTLERPRTIWAGVGDGASQIEEIVGRIEGALSHLRLGGKRRQFHPHLTLGRVKDSGGLEELAARLKELRQVELGTSIAQELVLFSSVLTRRGPEYTRLAGIQLVRP